MHLYIVKQIKLTENVSVGILREVKLVLVAAQQTFPVNIDIYFNAILWQAYNHLLHQIMLSEKWKQKIVVAGWYFWCAETLLGSCNGEEGNICILFTFF